MVPLAAAMHDMMADDLEALFAYDDDLEDATKDCERPYWRRVGHDTHRDQRQAPKNRRFMKTARGEMLRLCQEREDILAVTAYRLKHRMPSQSDA